MNISQAIIKRRSIRDFLDTPVDLAHIDAALELAKYAPSSTNMQPWEVVVVSGARKEQLSNKVKAAYLSEASKTPDYRSYPNSWFEPFKTRRKALGLGLYQTLGIEKEDKAGQIGQWVRNYEAFNAPVIVFILMDARLSEGSYLDCGMFMQNFMLALMEHDLGSCPQAAFIDYAGLIKEDLLVEAEKILLAGIAVGYPNDTHPINQFDRQRTDLSEFVRHESE